MLLLLSLVASCGGAFSADTRVTLLADENWEVQVELVLTLQQAQLALGQIDQAMNELISELRATGVEAEWQSQDEREDGNVGYLITARGQGLDRLNTAFFDGQAALYADESSGQRQIVFRYNLINAIAQRQTLTLRGGRILSSNGVQTDSRSVMWTNPNGPIEAVLTEAPRYAWLPYSLIGMGGLLFAVAVFGMVSRARRRAPAAGLAAAAGPRQTVSFCSTCGAALPPEATFCPRCGAQR